MSTFNRLIPSHVKLEGVSLCDGRVYNSTQHSALSTQPCSQVSFLIPVSFFGKGP